MRILQGNALDRLREMDENSIDAIVANNRLLAEILS